MRALFLFLLFDICFTNNNAQKNAVFVGAWSGKLNVGIELRIVFHIKETGNGVLSATADSPDQSAYGLKCDTTIANEDKLSIEMHDLGASFSGTLLNDSIIEGTFKQMSAYPLRLTRGEIIVKRNRPQTPQPPYPYKSEDVEYDNAGKSLHFGATITIPPGKGPFPAAVLITGSGPQNRNEEIMGHQTFAVIADALTKKGVIVLRVDDRGMGKSTGKFVDATTADFADDVNASLNYLLSRPETDKNKVGLVGHSEGGMIAPMVASKRKDINFIILLAAPAIKLIDLMAEQNVAILISGGTSKPAADAYGSLYKEIATGLINSPDSSTAVTTVTNTLNKWLAKTNKDIVKVLGLQSEKEQQNYIESMARGLSGKWFTYFMSFDPATYLQQLNCKVLALNGEKDIQVISSSNLAAMRANLKQSKAKSYEVKELPGLNHLFQHCTKCTPQEYGELEETFSPAALEVMTGWIEKNVK